MSLFEMLMGAELAASEARSRFTATNILAPDQSLWKQRPTTQPTDKLSECEARVGQLHLVVAAIVRSLVQKDLIKPAELSQLMKEIDLEDGKADGQVNEPGPNVPEWCPKCEARVQPGKLFCVFCGKRFIESATQEIEHHAND